MIQRSTLLRAPSRRVCHSWWIS